MGAVLFRLPALINAAGVHSDAAIVGLQARHMLQGEWSRFLWGAGYQGSVDAVLLAVAFAVFGATPLVLMAVPLSGHLLLAALSYRILQKRLGAWSAALCCLPLVFSPAAVNGVALYAPRQWSLTLVSVAIWLVDGAAASRWSLARYSLAVLTGTFSAYLDLFVLQLLAPAAVFAVGCCLDGAPNWKVTVRRAGALLLGGGLGAFVVSMLRAGATHGGVTGMSLDAVSRNLRLFLDSCFPWLLGYKVFVPGQNLYPDLWEPPTLVVWYQRLGAAALVVGILVGGMSVFFRRIPWEIRRLGALGFMCSVVSVGGFLVSVTPTDMWGARYLAPIIWTAPFALAPAAYLLGIRRFGPAIAVYASVAALGGWLSFGTYVRGPIPVVHPRGAAVEELQVAEALRARGVHYAAAQYWLSYRLTFLYEEDPVVIPLNPGEDRYPPYREAFQRQSVVAYVFHPSEPRSIPEPYHAALLNSGGRVDRIVIAGFTVLVHDKR